MAWRVVNRIFTQLLRGYVPPPMTISGKVLSDNGTWIAAGTGTGDVSGPGSSTDNDIAVFDLATGKVIKDSGVLISALAPKNSPTFTGTVTLPTPFTLGAVSVTPTGTELNFVDGVTSAIQTQLNALAALIASLDSAVILKGLWDASAGTFPGADAAQAGWSYIVSVAGTVDGVAFAINDRIVAIIDNASTTTYAANWFKLDYTDSVLSVQGLTGAVTITDANLSTTDVTTNNATTAKHGFMPKGTGSTSTFFRSDMTQAIPTAAVDIKEVVVNVPLSTLEYSVIVVDGDVSPSSQIQVGWGNLLQTDENHPSVDDVWFNAIPGTGQYTVELIGRIGGLLLGDYKLNALIG